MGFSLSRSVESRPRGLSAGRVAAFRGGGFFGDAGKEEKGNGRGREEKSLVGRECGGLVWFTERRRTGDGRSGGWQWEGDSGGGEALNWGAEGDRRPLHGSSGVPEQSGEGTPWGVASASRPRPSGTGAAPSRPRPWGLPHLTGQPGWLFPSWLGAGALTGLWVAGAAPGQWRPPNDPVDDG